jgi:hypothetical protein
MEDQMTTEIEKTTFGVATGGTPEIVKVFNRALLDADELRQELADAGDYTSLAYGLVAFKDLKANLDILVRAIEDDVAAHLPAKKHTIEGLGTFERRSTTSRKWDSEGLMQYMVRDVLDPDRTGEVNYDRIWDLIEALKAVLPLTASLGWRVTALKELGMPVDNFAETTYGRQTISVVK